MALWLAGPGAVWSAVRLTSGSLLFTWESAVGGSAQGCARAMTGRSRDWWVTVPVMSEPTGGAADFTATLARKRMASAVLFTDDAGRVLLVEPTYKDYWELPGGAVDADESPYTAACREVKEELALPRVPGRLLVVDWVPPRPDRTEGLMLVFDGGVLSAEDLGAIRVPADELRGWALCTGQEQRARLSPMLARRAAAALQARLSGEVAYLEHGSPTP